ncbi:MAG: 3-oxoacyl-[acyl-carrier-protein] synthase III C-terminal domain-containing protein [Pseudobdellovibrionaceae bacterium]
MNFKNVYLNGTGSFLPGPAVNNEEMDAYIGSVNGQSSRIKRRILAENGIKYRHYGIDKEGNTKFSSADMAIQAINAVLDSRKLKIDDIEFLSTGTVGADLAAPGFANLIQGQYRAAPMQTMSLQGICASGVAAMKVAAQVVELGEFKRAVAVATEFPSRLFKATRFQQIEENLDFDSHFLRWMLSDGSGAVLFENKPAETGFSLKLDWIHLKSFSGDYPTCMQIGSPWNKPDKSYLDYSSLAEAEKSGSFLLRQDIRLLPNLFDVGVSEFIDIVLKGKLNPQEVDHFLCHYSSEKFSDVVSTLIDRAGLQIPKEKWFSNLTSKGNTGAASIFIMLDEFMKTRKVKAGEKILCFIPESGRFTVSFMMFEVVENGKTNPVRKQNLPEKRPVEKLLLELGSVWHQYRSSVFRTELANRIFNGKMSVENYQVWMENWIPQVREGSVWMRTAISNLSKQFVGIQDLIEEHAGEEQFDFKVLYADYQNAGGAKDIDDLRRNPAGEELNAYMYERARSANPLGLLGGIFIIEGTGQKIIPTLLPFLKRSLNLQMNVFKFLEYHGENDVKHLERWANAVELALEIEPDCYQDILDTARKVAELYHKQWTMVL